MVKFNEHVYLLDQRWYRVQYNPETYYFKFKPCDTPNLVARHSCILPACSLLLKEEKQALQALLHNYVNLFKQNKMLKLFKSVSFDYDGLC